MKNQYTRFEALIGKDKLESLKEKKILVFGLGGVGGNVVDSLVRAGISNLTIVDNDVVDITNINRQLIANMNTIGRLKVDVMEEHILSINPEAKVNKMKMFYLPDASNLINFKDYDYVIDAIDTVSAKIDIIVKCKEQGVNVISCLGCGNRLDPSKLEVTYLEKTSIDPLAKVLRKAMRDRRIKKVKVVYSTELPYKTNIEDENKKKRTIPSSSSFVPPSAGILIASEVIKDLLNN